MPAIRGAVPPGGLLGSVISNELRSGFNMWGANLLVIAILITAPLHDHALFVLGRACLGGKLPARWRGEAETFCSAYRRAGTTGAMRAKTSACAAVCKRRAPPAAKP